jgi:hypothetical protein
MRREWSCGKDEAGMDWHCGRLIDHLNIDVVNLEAARRFYRASAAALGREEALEKGEG